MKDKINLSICTVIYNDETRIHDYLSRIEGRAGEVLLIDLGSTDRTVELCRTAGVAVYPVHWKKNRSEIKNFCMDQASGRWIFFLRTDERMSDEHWNRLYSMLDNPNAEEYLVDVELSANYDGIVSPVDSLRLIRNRKEYRYQGRSYEYIPDEIIGNRRDSELRIQKVREDQNGCVEFAENLFDAERALLLTIDLEENPQSAYLLYRTGMKLLNQGKPEEAAHYFETAKEHVIADYFFAPHLYKCLAWSYLSVENPKAVEILEEGIRMYPAYLDLMILKGEFLKRQGEYQKAIVEYERGLQLYHSKNLKTVGTEIGEPAILENLGFLHEKLMNRGKAEICYLQMFNMGFSEKSALRKLSELLIKSGDEEGFELIYGEAVSKNDLDSLLILIDALYRYHQYSRVLICLNDVEPYLDTGEAAFIKASCLKALGQHTEANCYIDSLRMELKYRVPILQQELETLFYEGQWENASGKLSEIESDELAEGSLKTALYKIYNCLIQTSDQSDPTEQHACGPLSLQEQEVVEGILYHFLWMGRIESVKKLLLLLLNGKDEREKEEILKELAERDILYGSGENARELASFLGVRLQETLTLLLWSRKMMQQLEQLLKRIPLKDSRSCLARENNQGAESYESAEYHLEKGDQFAASGKQREAFFAYLQAIMRDPCHESACNRIGRLILEDEEERMVDLHSDRWILTGSYFHERCEFRDFIAGLYAFWRGQFQEAAVSFEKCRRNGSGSNIIIQIHLVSAYWLHDENEETARQRIKYLPNQLKNGVFRLCRRWILGRLLEYSKKYPDTDLITDEIERMQAIID